MKLVLRVVWVLLLVLSGCDFKKDYFVTFLSDDDLSMAIEAKADRNWPLAERLVGRYLREERDPEKRWQAWELLLDILNAVREEPRASLECLDAMLVEYEGEDLRLIKILPKIGYYNEYLRYYDRAAKAWDSYMGIGILSPEEKVEGMRSLARLQMAQRYFEAAEETLQQCISLIGAENGKTGCMLDLADVYMTQGNLQESADICLQIIESRPNESIIGQAAWLRGDALEQLGNLREALVQFETGRQYYPNPAVMDNRIAWLKKKLKEK